MFVADGNLPGDPAPADFFHARVHEQVMNLPEMDAVLIEVGKEEEEFAGFKREGFFHECIDERGKVSVQDGRLNARPKPVIFRDGQRADRLELVALGEFDDASHVVFAMASRRLLAFQRPFVRPPFHRGFCDVEKPGNISSGKDDPLSARTHEVRSYAKGQVYRSGRKNTGGGGVVPQCGDR